LALVAFGDFATATLLTGAVVTGFASAFALGVVFVEVFSVTSAFGFDALGVAGIIVASFLVGSPEDLFCPGCKRLERKPRFFPSSVFLATSTSQNQRPADPGITKTHVKSASNAKTGSDAIMARK
jgi:phage shock protein PspC (stress-responsive transcriptional regulator)